MGAFAFFITAKLAGEACRGLLAQSVSPSSVHYGPIRELVWAVSLLPCDPASHKPLREAVFVSF
jgi:hypothetical protein